MNINNVVVEGLLTKDCEVRKTNSGLSVCQFTVAVKRNQKDEQGNRIADFINCVAWRQKADYLGEYGKKGQCVSVKQGRLQTRNYDRQDGTKAFVMEVLADEVELEYPRQNQNYQNSNQGYQNDYQSNYADVNPKDLPF